MSDDTETATDEFKRCSDCHYGRFGGLSHVGQCIVNADIPFWASRFFPRVGGGTLRSVSHDEDGRNCPWFARHP